MLVRHTQQFLYGGATTSIKGLPVRDRICGVLTVCVAMVGMSSGCILVGASHKLEDARRCSRPWAFYCSGISYEVASALIGITTSGECNPSLPGVDSAWSGPLQCAWPLFVLMMLAT